ncbi:hypothetical protein [Hydrogenophaga sp.]|uniref:hypothetical protein n=1 Tax=Hydrogenophaga sp. TaxID=1904254 RepID=UPI002718200D|nr:hypothetical protein [Hydrogenophaga sp.]MDO9434377.1 hypothetical protein [Hydrogenophaga sp.]
MNNIGRPNTALPTPLSQVGQQPPKVTRTPDAVWGAWVSHFALIPSDVNESLRKLAHGQVVNDGCIQTAFDLLMKENAFDAFLEIFEAHRTTREAAAGAPVKMALCLTWAQNWSGDIDKLEAMFKRLRVDSLTVDAGASPLPTAGCRCMALLLKGGVSELSVAGSLTEAWLVAQAFTGSALRSIAFWGPSLSTDVITAPLDANTGTTTGMLLDGLLNCSKLESLAIHDEHLLELRYFYKKLLPHRQALHTLKISLRRPVFTQQNQNIVRKFMQLVQELRAFSSIALTGRPDMEGLGADDVDSAILVPLSKHTRLASFELRHMPRLTGVLDDVRSPRLAVAFMRSCGNLAYFVWEAAASPRALESLRDFVSTDGNLHMPQSSAKITKDAEELLPRMKKIALIGHLLTIGHVDALTLARGEVDSEMDLDLRESLMDAEKAIALAAAWKKGKSPGKLLLPAKFENYYLLVDNNVWGIMENPTRTAFVLVQGGGLGPAASNRAIAQFEALKPKLEQLMREIHQQVIQSNAPLLQSNVQAFMDAALRSASPNVQGAVNEAFWLPAATILEQLVKEERTPTLVRLAEVTADAHKRQQTRADERDADLAHVHLRSDTQRMVQMERATDKHLMEAVESLSVPTITGLLKKGTVDTGGRAFQRARQLVKEEMLPPSVLDLFMAQVPTLAPPPSDTTTAPVTTINTTTTTTTTQTTGTLGTSTTSTPAVNVLNTPVRPMDMWRHNVRFAKPAEILLSTETPSTSNSSTQAAKRPKTPAQSVNMWKKWKPELRSRTPREFVEALQLLAKGTLSDASVMQGVFAYLIETRTFGVFVEAFKAYGDMERLAAEALHAPPFKSSLVLELPHNWAPDVAEMNRALQRVQVDTLILKPDPSNPDLPWAACQLVATLLKGGTTVLQLGGVLEYPQCVVQAMAHSQLRSLTLHGVPNWPHYLPAHIESQETLVSGLVGCTALEEVVIRDEKLFAVSILLPGRTPKLNALGVSLGSSMTRSEISAFMVVAGRLPTLSRVKVHFDVRSKPNGPIEPVDVTRVQAAILYPFTKNPYLTSLDMGSMPMVAGSPINMTAAPKAFAFAASCPSLKQFSWTAIPSEKLTVQHLRAFVSAGADLDMITASTQIAKAYAKPHASLTTLSFTHFVLPPGPMQAWSAALAANRSLRHLDLSGCLMDAQSAATLLSSLQQNPLFETLKVSTNHSDYYFRFEGVIWSIAQKSDGSGLELVQDGQPDGAFYQRAAVAFKAVEDGLRKLIEMSLGQATEGVVKGEVS